MSTNIKQPTRQQELIAIDERLDEIHKTTQSLSLEATHLAEHRTALCDQSVLDYDCPHRRAGEMIMEVAR